MSTDEYDAYLLWKLSAQQHLDYFRKDVKNLKAENEKLREDLEDQEGYDQMLRDRLRQQTELHVKAEAENAKLRKLVRDMWEAIGTHKRINFAQLLRFGERLQELGIEVEG